MQIISQNKQISVRREEVSDDVHAGLPGPRPQPPPHLPRPALPPSQVRLAGSSSGQTLSL